MTVTRSRFTRLLPVVVALALTAAACGGGGGGSSSSSGDDASGDAAEPGQTELVPDTAEPQYGGTVVYGIEADTSNPWTPQQVLCAISCSEVLRSVYDPIAEIGEDGTVQPVLAESIEHNDDYTVWTVKVREGITFHDGTELTAEDLKINSDAVKSSPTLAIATKDVDSTEVVDDYTVQYNLNRPWTAFDYVLTTQVGFVASGDWLEAVQAGTAQADEPVGTGAFVFESYDPGGSFVATANPDYWRTDAEGRSLPYLDRIEFKVFEDVGSRTAALESGQIDLMHTANFDTIAQLRGKAESGEIDLIENSNNAETNYLMLNAGDPESDLADVRVRQAIAYAMDYDTINQSRSAGIARVANGPFPPGTPGYLDDSGYPTYDPEMARQLVDEYEAENGPIEIGIRTTSDQFNLLSAQLFQQYLQEVGIDASIDQQEQGEFVLSAAKGEFELFLYRNLATQDPDQNNVFWGSDTSGPIGSLAINFGRIEDDVIDENLDIIRESDDPAERTTAAEAINRRFAEQVYNVWLTWGEWAIASQPDVHQIATGYNLPDGGENLGMRTGTHQVSQIWVEQ
ncbi:MAG: ABC transporter substrate-binding protein [Acidimicrobiales bacterium]|nr:ABC transporter substrate-binding protein [Acidimicrobiales bacterium]MCB1016442.1 ABC transporter substrate-binding protein [Acidimicrobiales bacterium]MCB9373726.1 ABC transporter substrate-binding protein [Microthrixaceae bacterium]